MPRENEEGVPTGVDLQLVALAEDVGDVVLGFGRLTLGPRVIGGLVRVRVGAGGRLGREAPGDGGAAVLDEGSWGPLSELVGVWG